MSANPSYEEIAERHWKVTRPMEYRRMTPSERTELFRLLADEVRAQVRGIADEARMPQNPHETFEQAQARRTTAFKLAEAAAIREILLPAPTEEGTPTDPELIEGMEERRRRGF
jgi:hypothetical protein